jgi:hypothetical protein
MLGEKQREEEGAGCDSCFVDSTKLCFIYLVIMCKSNAYQTRMMMSLVVFS